MADALIKRAAARDLLPIAERVLGPDHPDTLAVRWYLARATGEAGDPAAVRDLLAELVPVRRHTARFCRIPADPVVGRSSAAIGGRLDVMGEQMAARTR